MQESSPTALRYLQDLSDTRPPTLIKGGPGSRTTLSTTISTLPFHEGLLARTNHVSTCALALSLKTRVLWLVVLFVLLQPTLPTVYLFTERDQLHQLTLFMLPRLRDLKVAFCSVQRAMKAVEVSRALKKGGF